VAAPVAGKLAKVYVKQFDLTTHLNDYSASSTADELDATTFGAGAFRSYIGGFTDGSMDISGLYDKASGATDETMNAALSDTTPFPMTIAPQGFAPGNRVFMLKAIESSYELGAGLGDIQGVSASMVGSGGTRWAQVLMGDSAGGPFSHGNTAQTGAAHTHPGLSVATGITTKGFAGHLHLFTNTLNQTISVAIEHADDSGFTTNMSTLASFSTISAATIASQRVEVAPGTDIRAYLRAKTTLGGAATGAATLVVTAARGY
jgi:hypothetical protein